MTVRIGDTVPNGSLSEFIPVATDTCPIGPLEFKVSDSVKGKKIVVFAVPGAFTPTCSAKHVPGYLEHAAEFKQKGIDEIWCVSVNDAFVMGAWAKDQKADGVIRMLADGSGVWTKAMGLELDLTARGLGVRSQRYSMLIDDGRIVQFNLDDMGKLEKSDAVTLLKQL